MEKSRTRLFQIQQSMGAPSSTKSLTQHSSKTLLYLTANTWVIFSKSDHQCGGGSGGGQGTVTLLSILSDSTIKIPLPGVTPQRQLLGSTTPKQSGQRVDAWTSFPLSLPVSKASKRTIPKPQRKLAASYYLPCIVHSPSLSSTF